MIEGNVVSKRVIELLAFYNRVGTPITFATRPTLDLTLDSLDLVQFVNDLEKEFNFRIPDADVNSSNFATVEKICRYIVSRTQSENR